MATTTTTNDAQDDLDQCYGCHSATGRGHCPTHDVTRRTYTLFSFEIDEEDFIQMYKDKYNKEPKAGDYDRFVDIFLEEETVSEELNDRIQSEVCKALNSMNDDENQGGFVCEANWAPLEEEVSS
jgi:hypothetical protein